MTKHKLDVGFPKVISTTKCNGIYPGYFENKNFKISTSGGEEVEDLSVKPLCICMIPLDLSNKQLLKRICG